MPAVETNAQLAEIDSDAIDMLELGIICWMGWMSPQATISKWTILLKIYKAYQIQFV